MKIMFKYLFYRSKKLLVIATIAGLISGLSGAWLVKEITTRVNVESHLESSAYLYFSLCAAFLLFKIMSEMLLIILAQSAIHQVRVDLSQRLLSSPFKKLLKLGKSNLLAVMTNDVAVVVQSLQMMPSALGNLALALGCFAYMAWLSVTLFLVVAVCVLLGTVAYHYAERIPLRLVGKLREQTDVLYGNFRDLIEGSKELLLNRDKGAAFIDNIITPESLHFKALYLKTMRRYCWIANWGNLMFYLIIGAILFVAPTYMTINTVVISSFAVVLMFLIKPINEILHAIPMIRQAGVSFSRIIELGSNLEDKENAPQHKNNFASVEPLLLELKQACHKYVSADDDRTFVLEAKNLTIQHSEIVFIVGGNGSGKTTLAMMLLGLFEPDEGEIKLNGIAVSENNISDYRQHFSAVFSDFHLFEQVLASHESEQYNVQERVIFYLNKLGLSKKVSFENGKFSTLALSSGQRKRLALVSAYLEDRSVYVFDEWAADQDPEFKKIFYTELLPELKARGKAVIAITHDDYYFNCADRILKLQDGKIISDSIMKDESKSNLVLPERILEECEA